VHKRANEGHFKADKDRVGRRSGLDYQVVEG